MGVRFKDLILYDMGESTRFQGKLAAIRCANSLILEYEEGVEKIEN